MKKNYHMKYYKPLKSSYQEVIDAALILVFIVTMIAGVFIFPVLGWNS